MQNADSVRGRSRMASLTKQGNLYYIEFYNASKRPKRKRVPLRVRTKREAEKLRHKLEYEYAAGVYDPWRPVHPATEAIEPEAPPPFETVTDAAEAFFETRAHRTASTRRTYHDIIGRFAAFLPNGCRVAEVTATYIEGWLDSTPTGDVTRRTYTKHLSTFFRYCVDQGVIAADPTCDVRLRRVPRRFPKALSEEEVIRLITTIEAGPASIRWLRDIVIVTVNTGLRRAEAVNLRWRAVDIDNRVLTVACDEGFQTKSGTERKVPLAPPALLVLERLQRQSVGIASSGEAVFQHSRGGVNPDYLSQRFALYARKAEINEVGFHGLRHTAITRLIERGVPLPIVQRFAGHADIATTMRYCSIADDIYAERIRSAFEAR